MIQVYDQNANMLAILENAHAVGYQLPHNDLWTATFKLPNKDPKNAFCRMHNLVRLDDGPRELGMYRIIGIPDEDVTGPTGFTSYSCEHVAATLLDDILFGYHEIGGAGVDTAAVIRYILARQEVPALAVRRVRLHPLFFLQIRERHAVRRADEPGQCADRAFHLGF